MCKALEAQNFFLTSTAESVLNPSRKQEYDYSMYLSYCRSINFLITQTYCITMRLIIKCCYCYYYCCGEFNEDINIVCLYIYYHFNSFIIFSHVLFFITIYFVVYLLNISLFLLLFKKTY